MTWRLNHTNLFLLLNVITSQLYSASIQIAVKLNLLIFQMMRSRFALNIVYTQKVNLTERNVENVLIFADYINLTDVHGICIDYIIKHIDQSNLGHVIGLGYKLEIKELIEAGVKNLGPQDINSLDTFSKDMINDVVRLQQEQVTIMTQVQWQFNLIKQWLRTPNDEMGFEARGSSVHGM